MEEQQNSIILPESKESIELELTAKGLYKWTIKLREEFMSVKSLERFAELSNQLRTLYPNNVMDAGEKK